MSPPRATDEPTSSRPTRPTAGETNLYSEDAEFLVLGHLLIRGLHASKAYTRYPGWDILANDPESGRTCRIQVKARLATDFDLGFPTAIKNFDAEFVVLVALNRGYRYGRRTPANDDGVREPDFYLLPMPLITAACEREDSTSWGASKKVYIKRQIPDWESYLDNWRLIVDALVPSDPHGDDQPSQ